VLGTCGCQHFKHTGRPDGAIEVRVSDGAQTGLFTFKTHQKYVQSQIENVLSCELFCDSYWSLRQGGILF
jgi:hypothetical protein